MTKRVPTRAAIAANKQASTPAKTPATKAVVGKTSATTTAVKTTGASATATKTSGAAATAVKPTGASATAAKAPVTNTAAAKPVPKTPAAKTLAAKTVVKTPAAKPGVKSTATPAAKSATKTAAKPAAGTTTAPAKTALTTTKPNEGTKVVEKPAPAKEPKVETAEEKAAREAAEEKKKQFIPSDANLSFDFRQVQNQRSVLVYNIGMSDLSTENVRKVIDKAISSALMLEHDDTSGRAILQFPSSTEAKAVAKELSELLADAQVQQGMGADPTEDLNGLIEQLKQIAPQLTIKQDVTKIIHYGILVKGEPLLPSTLTEDLLKECFPAAINTWIPVGRAPDPSTGQLEQTARYAFAQYGSSEEVEKALKGLDVSKLGDGIRVVNYDELRDGTFSPWPKDLKPKEKTALSDTARKLLIEQLGVQVEYIKSTLAYVGNVSFPSAAGKLKLKNQRKLCERIVTMLNTDRSIRLAAKQTLPDTDEDKKFVSTLVGDVNKLCKQFDDAEKSRAEKKSAGKRAASASSSNGGPAKKLRVGGPGSIAAARAVVRSSLRPQRGGAAFLNRNRVNPLLRMREGIRPMMGANRMMNQGPARMNQGPGPMNQGRNQGPGPMNQGMNQGPRQMNQGPGPMNLGPGPMNQGPRQMNQGPRQMNQGPGPMNQGPGPMNQGRGILNQGPMNQGGPNPILGKGPGPNQSQGGQGIMGPSPLGIMGISPVAATAAPGGGQRGIMGSAPGILNQAPINRSPIRPLAPAVVPKPLIRVQSMNAAANQPSIAPNQPVNTAPKQTPVSSGPSQVNRGNAGPNPVNSGNQGNAGPSQMNRGNQGNKGSGPNQMNRGNQGNMGSGPNQLNRGNQGNMGSEPNQMNRGNQGNMGSEPNQMNRGNQGNMGSGPNQMNRGNQGNMGSEPNQMNRGNETSSQMNRGNMGASQNRGNQGNMSSRPNPMNRGNQGNMGARGNQGSNMRGNLMNRGNNQGNLSSSSMPERSSILSRGIDLPRSNTSIRFDTSYPTSTSAFRSSAQDETLDLIRSLKEELKTVTQEVVQMRSGKSLSNSMDQDDFSSGNMMMGGGGGGGRSSMGADMGGSMGGDNLGGNYRGESMGGNMGGGNMGGNMMGGDNMGGNLQGGSMGGNMRGGSMGGSMGGGNMGGNMRGGNMGSNRGMMGGRSGQW